MNNRTYFKILLSPLILLSVSDTIESEGCIFEPTDMAIFLDMTTNVNGEVGVQIEQLATSITSRSPAESKLFVNSLGDLVDEIVSSKKSSLDLSWADNLYIRKDLKQFGDTLSSTALENELKRRFSVNQYKDRAEIVVLIVSSSSKINVLPNSYFAKKNTFVVVFGSSIPNVYKKIASREDHLYLVKRKDELEAVTDKILKQISCDSKYYCDTDMYSLKKGYKCKECSSVCGEDLTDRTLTCKKRCPFIRARSSEKDSDVNPSVVPDRPVDTLIEDNKYLVIGVVVGVICAVVLLLGALFLYKRRKKPILTPSSSNDTLPKRPFGPEYDKVSIEETGTDATTQEQTPFLEPNISDQASTQADKPDEESTNSVTGIQVDLKNKREIDLNAHYSDQDVVFLNDQNRRGRIPTAGPKEEKRRGTKEESTEQKMRGTVPLDGPKEQKLRGTVPLDGPKEQKLRGAVPLDGPVRGKEEEQFL